MKIKILVIDDEQAFLDTMKMMKWSEEIEMVFCNNALSAVELIPEACAIISDVMMSNSEKLEAALALVEDKVEIVRMTGNLDHTGKKILFKPFSIKQFRMTVNELVENYKVAQNFNEPKAA